MTSQQIKCLADAGYNAHTDTTTYMRGNTSRKNMLKFAWQTKTEKTKYNWKEELTEEAIKTVTNEKTLEKIGKGVIRWIGKIKVMRKEIQKVHANYKEQDLMKDLRIEE